MSFSDKKRPLIAVAAGRGHAPHADGTVQGRHLEGQKYEILKFGPFWRIGVCIADSDILYPNISTVLGP